MLLVSGAAASTMAHGAGSASSVVSADVPSATSLDIDGCAPGTTSTTFTSLTPGTTDTTDADCTIGWSSNDSAMLRIFQADGAGGPVARPTNVWNARSAIDSGIFLEISAGSASTAYGAAVGAGVRSTTNGGGTWSTFDPGAVRHVDAAPGTPSTAVVVGDSGMVSRTTTSGAGWSAETSNTTQQLLAVSMVDADDGFAVGANGTVIRRTSLGGATWQLRTAVPMVTTLQGVSAPTASVVFVAGTNGALYRSEDGAGTWAAPATACNLNYSDIVATDANTAYAAGTGGRITKLTWNAGTSTLTCSELVTTGVGEDLRGIAADGVDIYASGVMGTLIHSNDAGVSWNRIRPGTAADLDGVAAAPDGAIWVAGTSDTVLRAPTGTTFSVVRVANAQATTLTAVAGVSATQAYVVGGQVNGGDASWKAAIRRTTTGGASWSNQDSGTTEALFGIDAPGDGEVAVAVGDAGRVVHTSNAGTTWNVVDTGVTARLWDVDMLDDHLGWAVGDDGTILRTTSGGASWQAQASGSNRGLRAVSVVDKDVVFAAGTRGGILRSLDGGATWTTLAGVPSTQAVDDLVAPDANTVVAVLGYRQLVRSANASAPTPTWAIEVTGVGGDHLSVDAVSPTALFVGNAWGTASRTLSGGAPWSADPTPARAFYGMDAVDENTAWATGPSNEVYLTTADVATEMQAYADAGPNWSSGTSVFGACLRDATGTGVTPSWTEDAACAPTGTGVWKGLPHTGDIALYPDARIASSAVAAAGTAHLRFGIKVASDHPAGRFSAGVRFEVVAPNG